MPLGHQQSEGARLRIALSNPDKIGPSQEELRLGEIEQTLRFAQSLVQKVLEQH
jgi:hypothetical protein